MPECLSCATILALCPCAHGWASSSSGWRRASGQIASMKCRMTSRPNARRRVTSPYKTLVSELATGQTSTPATSSTRFPAQQLGATDKRATGRRCERRKGAAQPFSRYTPKKDRSQGDVGELHDLHCPDAIIEQTLAAMSLPATLWPVAFQWPKPIGVFLNPCRKT